MGASMTFIDVEIEAGPAHEDGLSLRFKRADDDAVRDVMWVAYESELGLAGRWRVESADGVDGPFRAGATAVRVEDSSDGAVWLVTGGRHGLVLTHDEGATERVPYLALSLRTPMG